MCASAHTSHMRSPMPACMLLACPWRVVYQRLSTLGKCEDLATTCDFRTVGRGGSPLKAPPHPP